MSAKGTVSARPGLAVLSTELPEAVRGSITAFTVAARRVFADDLLSVVLFGSAAEGRMRQTSRVSGFGADGPLGGFPGYDAILQAMVGLMSIKRHRDQRPNAARYSDRRYRDRPFLGDRHPDGAA